MSLKNKFMSNEIPRRNQIDLYSPAEIAISEAMKEVEKSGCDVRLTDAIMLLEKAKSKVADYIDNIN